MWNFKIIERGIPERNPRETEFFRITSPDEAVVREFIQNSLDAKTVNSPLVKVRISFTKVNKEKVIQFLDSSLKDHLFACGFIEGRDYPESILCLILEDFGTTGLTGSVDPESGKGNYYNFWWREGISEKEGQRAGRWGLGKITFHMISKIRTFWGLTVRENDRACILMGKTLLKTHSLNGQRYHYFGYYCTADFNPINDHSIIFQFKSAFGVNRDSKESGLSLVIPLPMEGIDFDAILRSVIKHYFFPVIARKLEVEINDDNKVEILRWENIIEQASRISWDNTEWEGMDIRKIFEFVREGIDGEPFNLTTGDPLNPSITDDSFKENLQPMRDQFRQGDALKFKIPILINKSDGTQIQTFITIYLKRFAFLKTPFECYIRSGILVSEIKMVGNRPVSGLLVAEDPPICEFLGDCETPAHTTWNERTEGFAEKYINSARILRFIKRSMARIVCIIDEPPHERLTDFLQEVFYLPKKKEGNGGDSNGPDVPPIKREVPIFSITKVQHGFKVTLDPEAEVPSFPFPAKIKIAYDIFRGNPFSRYDKFDFDVGSPAIEIIKEECNLLSARWNVIEIEVTGKNFKLEAKGFDPNRDLVVDIKKHEVKE